VTYDIDSISISIDDVAVPPALPATGDDSKAVLEKAATSLTLMRFPLSLGDAAAELHVLESLVAEAKARIPDAVADAREQDCTWEDIAVCLGITPPAARRRFAAYTRNRPRPPMDD
jgi:hypothetical protein